LRLSTSRFAAASFASDDTACLSPVVSTDCPLATRCTFWPTILDVAQLALSTDTAVTMPTAARRIQRAGVER